MAIPDHVKRQAMQAVSNPETRGMIRLVQGNEPPASRGDTGTAEPSSRPQHQASSQPKPLSPEVKRQALAAVANPETRAMIQMTHGNESAAAPGGTGAQDRTKARTAEPSSRELGAPRGQKISSQEIGQQAKAVVSPPSNPQKAMSQDSAVTAQIRLVAVKGASTPQHTPSAQSQRITQTVAQKLQMGQDVDAFQRNITRDDFGRE